MYAIYLDKKFENTKSVFRIRIVKKERQHNDQKKKDKQPATKFTQKATARATLPPLQQG
jgi:hypothetical protein